MLSSKFLKSLAKKYEVSLDIIEYLTRELMRSRGESVRFNIEAIGGKGMWKRNQLASVGNGFNDALNEFVTDLCTEISNEIVATQNLGQDTEPTTIVSAKKREPGSLDETIGLTPISLKPQLWWPENYGEHPDVTGTAGGLRYAYFAGLNRLVIRQGLRNRIFDTEDKRIKDVSAGEEHGFFNLIVTSTEGQFLLTEFREVVK